MIADAQLGHPRDLLHELHPAARAVVDEEKHYGQCENRQAGHQGHRANQALLPSVQQADEQRPGGRQEDDQAQNRKTHR